MIVSRETSQRFSDYHALVVRWNDHINLVAPSTLADFTHRHIDDCRQIYDLAAPEAGLWADLGSGAGLPGLVVAILGQGTPLDVVLVESDRRKATFLRTVVRELDLQRVVVLTDRVEQLPGLNATVVSARALAPLPKLLAYVHRHMAADGSAWLMKGRNWAAENRDAQADWRYDLTHFASRTDPEAAILNISGVSHV